MTIFHTLEELGYPPDQIALIKKVVNLPHGAVIISGPTGSGKTTTLASAMSDGGSNRKSIRLKILSKKW